MPVSFASLIFRACFYSFLFGSCLSFSSCKEPPPGGSPKGTQLIYENGAYHLEVKEKPFRVRGVAGWQNLALLKRIGGNTIRTYDTTHLAAILDSAHRHGLKVIAGLELPKSKEDWFYGNDSLVQERQEEIARWGHRFKDHPALLLWCLGNELIYYDWLDWQFASAYNKLLLALHRADPHHPVGTAMANASDRALINLGLKVEGLDFIMFNTFGRLPRLSTDLLGTEWAYDGPFLIGEWGENGPWESAKTPWGAPYEAPSSQKAAQIKKRHAQLPRDNPRYLGNLAFFWGQRQERTHTWFNFFDQENRLSSTVPALARAWGKPYRANEPPQIQNLEASLSNGYHAFYKPGSPQWAHLKVKDPEGDSLHFRWTIRPEDWFTIKGEAPAPTTLGIPLGPYHDSLHFQAPPKSGPYRLFVKVTDGQDNFATANFPFYVVSGS